MNRSPPPVQRRRFLTTASVAGLLGLAGCAALNDETEDETEPKAQNEPDLQTETPEQVVKSYFESVVREQQTRSELHHSAVRQAFSLEQITTTVIEEDLSTSEFSERTFMNNEEVEEILTDAETAVVEADIEITRGGETVNEQVEWVVATEDGEWRLVDQGAVDSGSTSERDSDSDTDDEPEPDPEMPEAVHEYMIENDVQGYDGSLADMTGTESVTVDVGAGSSGLAFSPPVVRVDAGTEVVWEWTGEGGAHNVVSTDSPEEFANEDITAKEGYTWSYTFEQSGTHFYTCEPHEGIGMHGAIIVA